MLKAEARRVRKARKKREAHAKKVTEERKAAREKSAALIRARAVSIASGDRVVVMGDLTPIANALERMDGWDIVKLYRKKKRRPLFRRPVGEGLELTASFSATSGTFAYAIRREVAERLNTSHEEFQSPIDVEFRFRSRNRIRVFDCSEDLVIHDPNSHSTIEPNRSLQRTRFKEEERLWKKYKETKVRLDAYEKEIRDEL